MFGWVWLLALMICPCSHLSTYRLIDIIIYHTIYTFCAARSELLQVPNNLCQYDVLGSHTGTCPPPRLHVLAKWIPGYSRVRILQKMGDLCTWGSFYTARKESMAATPISLGLSWPTNRHLWGVSPGRRDERRHLDVLPPLPVPCDLPGVFSELSKWRCKQPICKPCSPFE